MERNYPFLDSTKPVKERIADLLSRLTVQEKISMLPSHMQGVERLGIGEWHVGCEVARGYVGRQGEIDEISTVFPQPIGMASMFDPELMYKIGEIAGDEARYYYQQCKNGKLMVWGPTVDMERDPRWGRTEEGYGEDPFLTGEMTKAYTKGLAGEDEFYLKTVPTLKHFCADNNEFERGSCSANVDPRLLHEYYYAAFKPAITEGGAHSIMAAYNELSGVPAVMNPDIQTLLKDEWGLDFVVTDGGDFSQNVLLHEFPNTHAEALALCLKNGADTMTDASDIVIAAAKDALERNLITEADIDKSVGNILLGRFRLGEFDETHPYKDMDIELDSEYAKSINKEAALKQVCLLKNNGILPLSKNKKPKIALIGPIGDQNYKDWYTGLSSYEISVKTGIEKEFGAENVTFDNGYDITALKSIANEKYLTVTDDECTIKAVSDNADTASQFEFHDWDFGSVNLKSILNGKYITDDGTYKAKSDTPYSWFIREWLKPTVYDGLYSFRSWMDRTYDVFVDTKNDNALTTAPSSRISSDKQFEKIVVSSGCERAAKLARNSDIAIVCVGNHPTQVARECYDRPDIVLPKHQQELIKACMKANKNTIVLIISSYPYAINWENENVPAIIYTSHAGPELGTAVAKTLSGENNPAARCPMTWYKSIHELPSIMDYDIITNETTYMYYKGEPIYPFGHGLSYSKFAYSDMNVTDNIVTNNNGVLSVTVNVKNTSDIDGDEVVQIYYHAENAKIKRPERKLCGFKRVHICAKTTETVKIDIPHKALEFYDVSREKLCVSSGEYKLMAGASCLDIRLSKNVYVNGENIPARDISKVIKLKNFDKKSDVTLEFSAEMFDHYAISHDWGGSITLQNVNFCDYDYAEIIAAAPAGTAELQIFTDITVDEPIGTASITPSPSKSSFMTYKIPLVKISGVSDLTLKMNGYMSLYSIQMK